MMLGSVADVLGSVVDVVMLLGSVVDMVMSLGVWWMC